MCQIPLIYSVSFNSPLIAFAPKTRDVSEQVQELDLTATELICRTLQKGNKLFKTRPVSFFFDMFNQNFITSTPFQLHALLPAPPSGRTVRRDAIANLRSDSTLKANTSELTHSAPRRWPPSEPRYSLAVHSWHQYHACCSTRPDFSGGTAGGNPRRNKMSGQE